MGIETAIGIGAPLVGGMMSADASENAAGTQAASAREANAMTQKQFDQMRSDLRPYRQTGSAANNLLATYLGLPGYETNQSGLPNVESFVTDAVGRSYDNGYRFADDVDRQQTINGALYNYKQGYYGNDLDTLKLFGYQPDQSHSSTDPKFGSLLKQFTGSDLENDPGYQFSLSEGNKALDRRAASGGSYFSGSALKAAQRYGNDYASTKFNDAYNRDAQNKNRIYSMLSGVSSQGQNAAAMTGNAGIGAANSMAQNTIGAGNALAAGQVGSANALTNGINGAIGAYQWNNLLNSKSASPDWTTPGYGWGGIYSDY